jgi:hypothetical protein
VAGAEFSSVVADFVCVKVSGACAYVTGTKLWLQRNIFLTLCERSRVVAKRSRVVDNTSIVVAK